MERCKVAKPEKSQRQAEPTEDPRALRSREALIAATTALIDAKPIGELSILQVVEAAGVTRPTFYRHFTDVADAARQAALARLQNAFPADPPCLVAQSTDPDCIRAQILDRSLQPLEHLRTCRVFYARVLEGAATVSFFQALVAFLATRMMGDALCLIPGASEDRRTLLAGGVMWLVIDWLLGGAEDPTAMARRLAEVVEPKGVQTPVSQPDASSREALSD